MMSPQQRSQQGSGNPRYAQRDQAQTGNRRKPAAGQDTSVPSRDNRKSRIGQVRGTAGQDRVSRDKTSGEQYFSAAPSSADVRRQLSVSLRGWDLSVETSAGVFSTAELDKGTAVLLKYVPDPPATGDFLDLGCGWGPLALSLAHEAPQARVWAVDSNQRALELTQANAARQGLDTITACLPEDLPTDQSFDLIWSNPPIRVGKAVLHDLLLTYLPRLNPGGQAYLVVQKHLGADSLMAWLAEQLGAAYEVDKYALSKGFRVIRVSRVGAAGSTAESAAAQTTKAAQAAQITHAAQTAATAITPAAQTAQGQSARS